MVFHSGHQDKANTCPRCATVTMSSGGQDINCSNPTCDVTFRRVVEESEDLAFVANDKSETALRVKETAPDDLRDGDKMDGSNVENDTLNIFLGEKGAEDGPDLFKRVRLFTRWQDSAESRGTKIETLGGVTFWDFAKTKYDIVFQLEDALSDYMILNHEGYIFEGFDTNFQEFFYWMGFLGKTLQQSYPVVLLYAKKKLIRRRAMNCYQSNMWVNKNGILVATCSGPRWKRHFLNWALENKPEKVESWRIDL